MVLARFGCHRAPFGSFPRVGKNTPHISGCAWEQHSRRRDPRPTNPRAARAATVPPGRQRITGITPSLLQAAPARKQLASLPMRLRPQTKRRGVRGQPWCWLGLAATGRPLVLSREWERTPRTPVQRAKDPCASGTPFPSECVHSAPSHQKSSLFNFRKKTVVVRLHSVMVPVTIGSD